MEILKDKVRIARRKAQSWLGILVYDSARGQVDHGAFAERLKITINQVLKLEHMQAIIKNALPKANSEKAGATIKKTLLKRQTSDKYGERITVLNEMLDSISLDERMEDSNSPNVFAVLTINWARTTGQNIDFIRRVSERLQRHFEKWQKETGYHDFSDSAVIKHPQEYGDFLAGFSRILLEETSDKEVANAGAFFKQAIQEVTEKDFNDTMQEAIAPVATFITRKTEEQLSSTFKSNPEARTKITSPIVEALVECEREKQRWCGEMDKAAEIIVQGLGPEFQGLESQPDKLAIISALRSTGRRSLQSNLLYALSGKLKVKFIENLTCVMKKLYANVKSYWEFSESTAEEGGHQPILQWLFRR